MSINELYINRALFNLFFPPPLLHMMMMSTILQALESSEKDDVSGNWKWGASAHITKVDTAKISTFAHDGDPSYMYATDLLRSAEDNDGIVRMDRSVVPCGGNGTGAKALRGARVQQLCVVGMGAKSIAMGAIALKNNNTAFKAKRVSGILGADI